MFGRSNGHGISKEDAAKRNYYDILTRHFWHICAASFWFALSNILFFGASYLLFVSYFSGDNLVLVVSALLNGKTFALPLLPFIPLMLTGPFTAGFTYVIRNFAKQEHTFIMSDFFSHSKKNIKQGLLGSVLSYLVMYLYLQAFIFYNSFFMSNGLPLGVLYTIFVFVGFLLVTTAFYLYPIMVTFKMKFKTIIKNAWTLSVLKMPQNFIIFSLLLLLNGALVYLLFFKFPLPELWFILMAFCLTGFNSYSANYYIWNVLDKYLVRPVTPKKDDEKIFSDEEKYQEDNIDDKI